MESNDRRAVIAAVLAWHEAMGVDAAVSADAIDWLQRGESAPGAGFEIEGLPKPAAAAATSASPQAARPSPQQSRPSLLPSQAPASRPQQTPRAEATAVKPLPASSIKARTLKELEAELRAFDGCALKATATNMCFYRGAEQARLMVIGEAPGRDEDLEGKPFVGRAGQLLNKMLSSIGISEEQVHITNVVYWRPPGNRTPTTQETIVCAPFLTRQIELVAPDVILALGAVAAKQILATDESMSKMRGNWFETNAAGRAIKTMASWHPAYLLRTPAAKRQAWRDLLAVKQTLK